VINLFRHDTTSLSKITSNVEFINQIYIGILKSTLILVIHSNISTLIDTRVTWSDWK